MDHTPILLIAVALALLVVLRWIFLPRRSRRGAARHDPAPRPAGAGDAWDGAARRRRDLAT